MLTPNRHDLDDIWSAKKVFQDFYFTLDLLLANWFEDLDDTRLVYLHIVSLF